MITAENLQALEASAEAAAATANALIAQIRCLRAAGRKPAEKTMKCPKCEAGPECFIETTDGRMACKACSAIF